MPPGKVDSGEFVMKQEWDLAANGVLITGVIAMLSLWAVYLWSAGWWGRD